MSVTVINQTCAPVNLELANWIHRSKSLKRNMQARRRFTVQSVEPADMEVLWIDFNENGGYTTHTEDLKPEDIKKYPTLPKNAIVIMQMYFVD